MAGRAAQRKGRAVHDQVLAEERSKRQDLVRDRRGRHPVREAPGDRGRRDVRALRDLGVSATGTLVYATGAGQGKQELVWVTRDGRAQAVDPEWRSDYLGSPALS